MFKTMATFTARKARVTGIVAASLFITGCATSPVNPALEFAGGPPFDLSADDRDRIGVRSVWTEVSSQVLETYIARYDPDYGWPLRDWSKRLETRRELENTLLSDIQMEVHQEIDECATGERLVDVVVAVEGMSLDGSAFEPEWRDELIATVEFVPLDSFMPIARYEVPVSSLRQHGWFAAKFGGLGISIHDPADKLFERLGRELCLKAFGRNPRPRMIMNVTK